MIALTGTVSRGSAFRHESSLEASKRENRSCQPSSWRLARPTACCAPPAGPEPVTSTAQVPPKHGNVSIASVAAATLAGALMTDSW